MSIWYWVWGMEWGIDTQVDTQVAQELYAIYTILPDFLSGKLGGL